MTAEETRKDRAARLNAMSLIAVNHLIWKRHLQRQLMPHEITLKQFYLLGQLAKRGVLYPMEIADMLFCDRPTASVVIGNMARRGCVRRERDPDNAKHVRVRLTPKGGARLRGIDQDRKTKGSGIEPLGCFTGKEIAALERLLRRLHDHLEIVVKAARSKS